MAAGKNVISLGEKFIQLGTKPLSAEITAATGYEEGIFASSEKTPKTGTVECDNGTEECPNSARVFEFRIIAVIDKEKGRIGMNDLSPEIRTILSHANLNIRRCLFHLWDFVGDILAAEAEEIK